MLGKLANIKLKKKVHLRLARRYLGAKESFLETVQSLWGGEGGQGGRAPLTVACVAHFGSLKILFVEHHATTRLQPMKEKGISLFKHNYPLKFSRFFAKLLATHCCT